MHTNFRVTAEEWVEGALMESGCFESVSYSVSFMLMPGPTGSPVPMWTVLVCLPSPLLGQEPIANMGMIQGASPPQSAFKSATIEVLNAVLKARADALAVK